MAFQDVIGISGMIIILFAFIMNQTGKWKQTYLIYDFSNSLGSFLLILYAYYLNSYPFLILNAVWLLVSIRDVFLDVKIKKKKKYTRYKTT